MANLRFRALYLRDGGNSHAGALGILEDGTVVKIHGQDRNMPAGGTTFVLTITDVEIDDKRKRPTNTD
jgi:hypothetical protein